MTKKNVHDFLILSYYEICFIIETRFYPPCVVEVVETPGSIYIPRNIRPNEHGWLNDVVRYIVCESVPSGLDLLHELTSARNYKLRIDLADFNGNHRYAEYSSFKVGSSATNYVLTVGAYSGNSGMLSIHLKYLFYKNCTSVCELSRFHTSIHSFIKVFRIMLIVNCYSEFTPVDTDMNAIVDSPF